MSFGTGEHQTTKLMLRQLEQIVKPGVKVLDVGSGTGILAITSVKFGAANAVAIDTDEICFENCKENCIQNDVENLIEIMTGEIENVQERDFDLIVANIQKNVLLDIAEKIKHRLKKNGIVILSGLLVSDQKEIEKKYHSLGFKTEQIEQMDEWIAITLN